MSVVSGIEEWWEGGSRERIGDHDVFVRLEGDGPWVTLLHGFPTSSYDWEPIVPALVEAGHRLLMFDFLGFGDSDKPNTSYSLLAQTEIVRRLWERHGVERTAVVAHDYGVSVAQELLAAGDEQVERVAFLNGGLFARLHRAQPIQKALRKPIIGAQIAKRMSEGAFAKGLRKVFSDGHQPTDAELHEHWLGHRAPRRRAQLPRADPLHRRPARERGALDGGDRGAGRADRVRVGRGRPGLRRPHARGDPPACARPTRTSPRAPTSPITPSSRSPAGWPASWSPSSRVDRP